MTYQSQAYPLCPGCGGSAELCLCRVTLHNRCPVLGASLQRGGGDVEEDEKQPTESHPFSSSMPDPSYATSTVGKPRVPVTPFHSPGVRATWGPCQESREDHWWGEGG